MCQPHPSSITSRVQEDQRRELLSDIVQSRRVERHMVVDVPGPQFDIGIGLRRRAGRLAIRAGEWLLAAPGKRAGVDSTSVAGAGEARG